MEEGPLSATQSGEVTVAGVTGVGRKDVPRAGSVGEGREKSAVTPRFLARDLGWCRRVALWENETLLLARGMEGDYWQRGSPRMMARH